jgi:flagellar hook protein FlgE
MGFQQGLSGLNAASKALDTIGNNVANSNTVGFKASQAQFADVYASSLTGAGASQIGIGVKVAQVAQQFTQGNITGSNNPLDVAINGSGFFRLSDGGTIIYSRNGQFSFDKDGYIVNANGSRLTGYMANAAGVLSTGAPTDININTADLPPVQTTGVSAVLNLDSTQDVPTTGIFNMNDPTSYNNGTSISVFDSLGNSHVVQTFYVKTAANTWDVYAATDGVLVPPLAPIVTAGLIGTLAFGSDGSLTPGAPLDASIAVTTGAVTPFTVPIDYSGTTQFGSNFSVNTLTQDGYTSGRLSGFNIGADGVIAGRYTNGQSNTLGQVVLASFTNPNGLQPLGNNVWAETSTSGAALVGAPNSGSLGVLQASAVEDSNVDLTAELVNMITAQRYYQANAQTIKTQDEVLQTLVNLR